jgi:AGCS family alanine or glycine:cation symporter
MLHPRESGAYSRIVAEQPEASGVEQIQVVIDPVSGFLWGTVLIYVLLAAGIYFSVKTRFVQIRRFGHMFKLVLSSRGGANGGISSFQAFCIGLASRVGTGNIAGVAIALTLGGPGAIFWMWMVALVGMATAFVEATLAQIFKVAQPDGTFRGGPAFYIQRGLGSRAGGVVFAVLLIFTFGIAFNAVQANTISGVLADAHTVPTSITGFVLAILAVPVFFGGMRTIAKVAEILLPLMALAYILLALVMLGLNAGRIIPSIGLIVSSAFGLGPAVAGVTGGFAAALLNGVKRGLFSNEAGMGSAPNTAATATVAHPAIQGFIQSLGVFVDTMVVCTITAIIILVSGVWDPAQPTAIAGATLTQAAVISDFGDAGRWFMTIVVFCFAFSSVLGNYAYAESNLTFLGASKKAITIFRVIALLAVLLGSISALPLVWAIADVAMALMTLVNIVAIVALGRWAFAALADYETAVEAHRAPVFTSQTSGLPPVPAAGLVW